MAANKKARRGCVLADGYFLVSDAMIQMASRMAMNPDMTEAMVTPRSFSSSPLSFDGDEE